MTEDKGTMQVAEVEPEEDPIFRMPDDIEGDIKRLNRNPPATVEAVNREITGTILSYILDLARRVAIHEELIGEDDGASVRLSGDVADAARNVVVYAVNVLRVAVKNPTLPAEHVKGMGDLLADAEMVLAALGGDGEEDDQEPGAQLS